MTIYDRQFVNDIMYRIEMSTKRIQESLYELDNFTEIESDVIKQNMAALLTATTNIKLELLNQGGKNEQQQNIDS